MSALPWVWGSLEEAESSSMGVGVLGGGQVSPFAWVWGFLEEAKCSSMVWGSLGEAK